MQDPGDPLFQNRCRQYVVAFARPIGLREKKGSKQRRTLTEAIASDSARVLPALLMTGQVRCWQLTMLREGQVDRRPGMHFLILCLHPSGRQPVMRYRFFHLGPTTNP